MPKSQVPDYNCATPEETQAVGAALARTAQPGDLFLLEGELGAGKTTLVRGFLNELGWTGAVRSPTFTLLNLYETNPPVLHADLYRVKSARGLGLEDYLDSHVCLVEWPEVGLDVLDGTAATWVRITPTAEGRLIRVTRP